LWPFGYLDQFRHEPSPLLNPPPPNLKRAVFSWALYDFANSSFTTIVVTFVYSVFFSKAMTGDEVTGSAMWATGVTVSALFIAILSPVLGAVADRGGYRKRFLFFFTVIAIGGTVMLYFVKPYATLEQAGLESQAVTALFWFVVANIGFELGGVFYNAFLPDIAPQERIGRISGFGWALGYLGGLICLVIALFGLIQTDSPWFGFTTEANENVRATCLLVAVWFAIFSVPMFLFVPEDRSAASPPSASIIKETWNQLRATSREIRAYRHVVRLLVARLFYNDGLVTIFAFGGIYAGTVFNFTLDEVIIFGIALNVAAGAGAWVFSFVDDRIGGKRTINWTLVGLLTAVVIAVLAPNRLWLWVGGLAVGIFAGPNQAASRSLLGRFVPVDKENEFFGFFAFSGKATAFLGPFLLGQATLLFHSQRAGVATVLIFLALGYGILQMVNEREGIRLAGRVVVDGS
jgi:UMF1 family MFS transporter